VAAPVSAMPRRSRRRRGRRLLRPRLTRPRSVAHAPSPPTAATMLVSRPRGA
jgi:hypothetical protein